MRIGSIIFSNAKTLENHGILQAVLFRVTGQDGDGLKAIMLNDEAASPEITLQPGEFHRLDDKKFEMALQARYGIDPQGEKLPNPKQPVYAFNEADQDGSFGEGVEDEELDEEDEED